MMSDVEPSLDEELATLGEDDRFDLANLGFDETGVEGFIFILSHCGARGPRVKWRQSLNRDEPTFSIAVAERPYLLSSAVPADGSRRMEPTVREWVSLNRAPLLDFWATGECWLMDDVRAFLRALAKVPER
jgi:hypothetical protein